MPISAIRNGTDAPPRAGGFRAQRVLGDRIADGDDYPELARFKTLIATFLEASRLRVGREAADAESNGVRFDERLAVRAPSPGSGAATLAPRVGAPETSHLVDLAATAHELRLPLSHIKGFVSGLRRTDVTWDEETRSEFLAEIEIETDRLTQLVDSLLTASARNGMLDAFPELTLATPASVVEGGLSRIRSLLKLRAGPLRLDVPPSLPPVWLDASRIERVLANLIQNAIKYSPPHTPIGVSARITHDGEFELSVDDEGAGIAVDDRQRIFEPFFRSQTTDQSKVDGHGLGLAICQAIVRAHGGRIQIFDRIGGGTRFSVFLPAQVRPGHLETKHHAKDQGNDSAEHSRSGRRGANAPASGQQSQSERLRREIGRRRPGGPEVARGAPVRPTAA